MAPRTFINKIDNVTIYTSPKCSCRSVSDFAWAVSNNKAMRCDTRINIIVFRNPYRRLISGYLNKYVEHTKYIEAARKQRVDINLSTFEDFVQELSRSGLRYIDKVHFSSQIEKYKRISFDIVSNSENLEPLGNYINRLFFTTETMPFRVNKYGPKAGMESSPSQQVECLPEPAWKVEAATLLDRIRAKQTPPYEAFFNESLKGRARELYEKDFDFLQACLDRGVINQDFHALMTRI
jgi:hypothetical protein